MGTATKALRQPLVDFCRHVGADPLLVQGAGGNVSWKDEDTLWVKASGTWLSEAQNKNIFVPINLQHVHSAIEVDNFEVVPEVVGQSELRPSIETMLHALLPHRVVVHLHAVEVIAYVVRQNWIEDLTTALGDKLKWAPVPYNKPGPDLARAVTEVIRATGTPDVLFLQNHGVVVGGDTVAEVDDRLHQLLDALRTEPVPGVGTVPSDALTAKDGSQLVPLDDEAVQRLAQEPKLTALMKSAWALSPDHVVFLGEQPCIIDDAQRAAELSSDLVFVENEGVFVAHDFTQAKTEQLRCYLDVIVRQVPNASLRQLKTEDIGALLNWEAEKYRQNLSK